VESSVAGTQAKRETPALAPVPLYDWVVDHYGLQILKEPGDLSVENGDIALTKDGDLKLGNDVYNALYRLVETWRFYYPHLRQLFDLAIAMNSERARIAAEIDELAPILMERFDPAKTNESFMPLHGAFDEHGATELGHQIYSSCIILLLDAALRRYRDDLGARETDWDSSPPLFNGVSFGTLVVASANGFRHADEWAKTRSANSQQKRSQRVLDAALGPGLANDRRRARSCSNALDVLSGGWSFDRLSEGLFAFAHDVASRRALPERR
jgi:hypothetical protein